MPNEIDTEIINALLLAVQWSDFKAFCKLRSNCKGCPYLKDHVCSFISTEKVMHGIAKAARKFLIDSGVPIKAEKKGETI